MEINAVRGTRDILPDENIKWQYIEHIVRNIFARYGYTEIKTPIFERTELFIRGIGETTDIVEKEMYTFLDRKGRSLTLRPEGTAGAIRAFLEHKMFASSPLTKLFYIGPMFRYERPQAGRYRQHTQIGAEALGSINPFVDAEIITMLINIFEHLGLKNLSVELNTVGCKECRPVYRDKLQEYLAASENELCEDCKNRLTRNPLRILDCKVSSCKEIVKNVPDIADSLCSDCQKHFDSVKKYLDLVEIKYIRNKFLVRGLDYYTKTVFEISYENLGAQNAVAAGGRYDNLIEELGGPSMPGIGFAMGIDRLVIAMDDQKISFPKEEVDVFLAIMGEEVAKYAFNLIHILRKNDIHAEVLYENKSLKNQFSYAGKIGSKFVIIAGENEVLKNIITIKNMETKQQSEVNLEEAIAIIKAQVDRLKV
ncbi:histidine--tRNA ligase [Candidatus Desantisbacteria bacterium]|nr:histidine--tRNA ligase [Candidatus Desantisbacteria bacterium]